MIELRAIGVVTSPRREPRDDDWGGIEASIELAPEFSPEALAGLAEFSHAEIIFQFDRVAESAVERGARHPRGNTTWPRVGIFAQRAKDRPNRIGLTTVSILGCYGRTLRVAGLDAVHGTPVLNIKPVMVEFLPPGEIRQPAWSRQLMSRYW